MELSGLVICKDLAGLVVPIPTFPFFTMNWVEVAIPVEEEAMTNDGSVVARLWVPTENCAQGDVVATPSCAAGITTFADVVGARYNPVPESSHVFPKGVLPHALPFALTVPSAPTCKHRVPDPPVEETTRFVVEALVAETIVVDANGIERPLFAGAAKLIVRPDPPTRAEVPESEIAVPAVAEVVATVCSAPVPAP